MRNSTKIKETALSVVQETWSASWELIRIIIPVAIITKVLQEYGLIEHFGELLEPVMGLIGLPGALGLVWATAILTNLYGGIAVFATVAPGLELSSAQVTVLCASMLFAHSLPVELSVAKRAGAGIVPIGLLRMGAALVYGYLLDTFCTTFGMWQGESAMFFGVPAQAGSISDWVFQSLRNLGLIVFIIFGIVVGMRVLRRVGILALLEKSIAPLLPYLGMTLKAAPITIVGMVMGIGYGGALIVRETKKGEISRREVINAMVLMGLCHGLVEDTIVMLAIGGKMGGIFWGRIIFSFAVTFGLVKLLQRLDARRRQVLSENLL